MSVGAFHHQSAKLIGMMAQSISRNASYSLATAIDWFPPDRVIQADDNDAGLRSVAAQGTMWAW